MLYDFADIIFKGLFFKYEFKWNVHNIQYVLHVHGTLGNKLWVYIKHALVINMENLKLYDEFYFIFKISVKYIYY